MTSRRAMIVVAVATAVGGAVTAAEHWLLRGYWGRLTSIAADMKADQLQAVCRLTESDRGELEPAAGVVDLAALCGTSGFGRCLEGQTILELLGNSPIPRSIPCAIDRGAWSTLWRAALAHNRNATGVGLGTPASGIVVRFTSGSRTYEWVNYSTHELENDWYHPSSSYSG